MRNKTGLGLVLSLLLAGFVGCVASDPGENTGGVPGGGDLETGGDGPGCSWTTVLATNCGGCHDSANKAAGLDLVSPGLATRVVDKASSACDGEVLVVAGEPTSSYLLAKLHSAPACGQQMPGVGVSLAAADYNCLSDWVVSLAGGGGGGGGGGAGDDGSGGGSSGSGGGGGW